MTEDLRTSSAEIEDRRGGHETTLLRFRTMSRKDGLLLRAQNGKHILAAGSLRIEHSA